MNTYLQINSKAIIAGNEGSTIEYCCLSDQLSTDDSENKNKMLDDD